LDLSLWVPGTIAFICIAVWLLGWGLAGRRGQLADKVVRGRQRPAVAAESLPAAPANVMQYETDMNVNILPKQESEMDDDILAKPDPVVPQEGDERINL